MTSLSSAIRNLSKFSCLPKNSSANQYPELESSVNPNESKKDTIVTLIDKFQSDLNGSLNFDEKTILGMSIYLMGASGEELQARVAKLSDALLEVNISNYTEFNQVLADNIKETISTDKYYSRILKSIGTFPRTLLEVMGGELKHNSAYRKFEAQEAHITDLKNMLYENSDDNLTPSMAKMVSIARLIYKLLPDVKVGIDASIKETEVDTTEKLEAAEKKLEAAEKKLEAAEKKLVNTYTDVETLLKNPISNQRVLDLFLDVKKLEEELEKLTKKLEELKKAKEDANAQQSESEQNNVTEDSYSKRTERIKKLEEDQEKLTKKLEELKKAKEDANPQQSESEQNNVTEESYSKRTERIKKLEEHLEELKKAKEDAYKEYEDAIVQKSKSEANDAIKEIYCKHTQIKDQVSSIKDLITENEKSIEVSIKDPQQPEIQHLEFEEEYQNNLTHLKKAKTTLSRLQELKANKYEGRLGVIQTRLRKDFNLIYKNIFEAEHTVLTAKIGKELSNNFLDESKKNEEHHPIDVKKAKTKADVYAQAKSKKDVEFVSSFLLDELQTIFTNADDFVNAVRSQIPISERTKDGCVKIAQRIQEISQKQIIIAQLMTDPSEGTLSKDEKDKVIKRYKPYSVDLIKMLRN